MALCPQQGTKPYKNILVVTPAGVSLPKGRAGGWQVGNVPFRSPGEAVLVLPPAGAAAASTAWSSRTRLLVAPSHWAPSRVLKIQSLGG